MPSRETAEANFFASLLDPGAIVAACQRSPALNALTSRKHSADRPGRRHDDELASWDAAIDDQAFAQWRRRNISGDESLARGLELAELGA
ncbi:MAG: hypothetical protein IT503_03225 [Burkholderiaceae bacterium]|nr:MAG: hypothetical protein F9K36_04565 [Burkholderiaceae bacterium]MCC7285171.1 hypothetical protein [Burkholderiaceae bacterium]